MSSVMYYSEVSPNENGFSSEVVQNALNQIEGMESAGLVLGIAPNTLYKLLHYAGNIFYQTQEINPTAVSEISYAIGFHVIRIC